MKKNISKKVLCLSMAGLLFLGNPLPTFAFTTTAVEGATSPDESKSNGVTDENRHVFNQIKDIMVPNVVNKVLETFPAFSYLNDAEIEIGFELFDGGPSAPAAAMDAVPQYSLNAQNNVREVVYSLRINTAARELVWNNNDFEYRSELEQLIAHEVIHAFLSEGMRSGMYGYDPVNKVFNTSEAIPLWFGEGVPQAIAGDRGFVENTELGGLYDKSTNEDIAFALAKLYAPEVGAYGVGYLASLYLAYWTGNKGVDDISNYKAGGETLAKGLNIFMQEIISGQSFDETIGEYTPYTGLADFEANFSKDEHAYDFVRNLLTVRGRRNPWEDTSPTGALLTKNLKATDILADQAPSVKKKLFTIHNTFKSTVVTYPASVNVMAGGSRNKSGQPPVVDYDTIEKPTSQLATPTNLTFQKVDDKLVATWDAVANASGYEVIGYQGINVVEKIDKQVGTRYEMDFPTSSGKYSVSVRAIGDTTYTNSLLAKSNDYEFVARPVLISKDTTSITIRKDFNHEYSIDNGKTWVSQALSSDSNAIRFANLTQNTEYSIIARVKATKTNSLPLIVKTEEEATNPILPPLATPTNIRWNISNEQATAVWDSVTAAASYEVQLYVDGTKIGTPITTTTLSYLVTSFSKSGQYQFVVKAIADPTTHQSSVDSSLSDTLFYVATPTLKLLGDKQVEVQTEENLEYSIDQGANWNSTGVFTNLLPENNYTIIAKFKNSPMQISKGLSITTLKTPSKPLDAPQNVTLTRNVDKFIVNWDSVTGAVDYEVTLYNGNTIVSGPHLVSKKARSAQMSYEMSVPSESGSYTSRVVAIGDGTISTSSPAQASGQVQYVVPPVVSQVQENQIVLTTKENHEYSIDFGVTWLDSGVFSNLKENTEYTIISRMKNTTELSDPIVVQTKAIPEIPTIPEIPEIPTTPEIPTNPEEPTTPVVPTPDVEDKPVDKVENDSTNTTDKPSNEQDKNDTSNKEDVITGDTSSIMMCMFLCISACMVLLVMRKRKRN